MNILQPPGWVEPRGYSNGIVHDLTVGSRLVFVGGQVGWNAQQQFETDDFAEQVGQTLKNIVEILKEADAGPEHIARMTWFVVDKQEYLAALHDVGQHYRTIIGRHFPCMTAVEVADLIEDQARIEIEVTAVVPAK